MHGNGSRKDAKAQTGGRLAENLKLKTEHSPEPFLMSKIIQRGTLPQRRENRVVSR
jgi:hypothetical protein